MKDEVRLPEFEVDASMPPVTVKPGPARASSHAAITEKMDRLEVEIENLQDSKPFAEEVEVDFGDDLDGQLKGRKIRARVEGNNPATLRPRVLALLRDAAEEICREEPHDPTTRIPRGGVVRS